MTITSSLRFVYILGGSSLLCAMQCHIMLSKNAKKLFERGWALSSKVIFNSKKRNGAGALTPRRQFV